MFTEIIHTCFSVATCTCNVFASAHFVCVFIIIFSFSFFFFNLDLPPIKKIFYQEHRAVANMDAETVDKFRYQLLYLQNMGVHAFTYAGFEGMFVCTSVISINNLENQEFVGVMKINIDANTIKCLFIELQYLS